MNNPTKPRPADVARWVALCAAPPPRNYAALLRKQNAQRHLLLCGLRDDGTPTHPATAQSAAVSL